jgi:quinol monooxygenase YgiN
MAQAAHIIRFTAKPESADDFAAIVQRALPHVLDDPTTNSWFVGRSEQDPTTFVLAHALESEEARSAHFTGPAATLILSEGGPLLAAEPAIENLSVVAGTAMVAGAAVGG